MINPIENARLKLNLDVEELASVCETVEVTVRQNERGKNVSITPRILNFLENKGFNREQLEKDYEEFRQWKVSEINKKMKVQG